MLWGATDEPASASVTLSRTASVIGGLLWACLAPVFVYADSALDKPGTAAFALAVSSMWLVGLCRCCFCSLASLNFAH